LGYSNNLRLPNHSTEGLRNFLLLSMRPQRGPNLRWPRRHTPRPKCEIFCYRGPVFFLEIGNTDGISHLNSADESEWARVTSQVSSIVQRVHRCKGCGILEYTSKHETRLDTSPPSVGSSRESEHLGGVYRGPSLPKGPKIDYEATENTDLSHLCTMHGCCMNFHFNAIRLQDYYLHRLTILVRGFWIQTTRCGAAKLLTWLPVFLSTSWRVSGITSLGGLSMHPLQYE